MRESGGGAGEHDAEAGPTVRQPKCHLLDVSNVVDEATALLCFTSAWILVLSPSGGFGLQPHCRREERVGRFP